MTLGPVLPGGVGNGLNQHQDLTPSQHPESRWVDGGVLQEIVSHGRDQKRLMHSIGFVRESKASQHRFDRIQMIGIGATTCPGLAGLGVFPPRPVTGGFKHLLEVWVGRMESSPLIVAKGGAHLSLADGVQLPPTGDEIASLHAPGVLPGCLPTVGNGLRVNGAVILLGTGLPGERRGASEPPVWPVARGQLPLAGPPPAAWLLKPPV